MCRHAMYMVNKIAYGWLEAIVVNYKNIIRKRGYL